MLVAQVAILLQRLVDDLVPASAGGRDSGAPAATGVSLQNRVENRPPRCRRERAACRSPFRRAPRRRKTDPCAHPVPCPAPAPATCRPPCPAPCPDWSGVARPSSACVSCACDDSSRLAGDDLGQTEVENLGVAALSDEDVGGLDVAMDDAFGVRRIQRIGDLDGERQQSRPAPAAGRRSGASASAPSRTPWR